MGLSRGELLYIVGWLRETAAADARRFYSHAEYIKTAEPWYMRSGELDSQFEGKTDRSVVLAVETVGLVSLDDFKRKREELERDELAAVEQRKKAKTVEELKVKKAADAKRKSASAQLSFQVEDDGDDTDDDDGDDDPAATTAAADNNVDDDRKSQD